MERNNLVAVYGSLREGHGNHALLRDKSDKLGEERINGFEMVSRGWFPSVHSSENQENSIVVEVYKVDDLVFKRLDSLEGYPSFYDRKLINTSFGEAWMYVIEGDTTGRPVVKNGDWNEYVEARYEDDEL